MCPVIDIRVEGQKMNVAAVVALTRFGAYDIAQSLKGLIGS